MLRIDRLKSKKDEDEKAEVQVINNICPTDYADVLTMQADSIGIERMRFGLVPAWAKGSKREVVKKFGLTLMPVVRVSLNWPPTVVRSCASAVSSPCVAGMSGPSEPRPTSSNEQMSCLCS